MKKEAKTYKSILTQFFRDVFNKDSVSSQMIDKKITNILTRNIQPVNVSEYQELVKYLTTIQSIIKDDNFQYKQWPLILKQEHSSIHTEWFGSRTFRKNNIQRYWLSMIDIGIRLQMKTVDFLHMCLRNFDKG